MARKAEVIFVGDADSLVAAAVKSKAAIKSLQDQASKKSGLDNLPTLGGNIATAALAAAPAVVGLAGALSGLAASATAAAGGAGAVAVGGLGALAVGFGSIALVAKPAIANFQKVTKALDAYNLTLSTHGTTAKQAAAAQAKLNAVVGQNGGAPVLAAAKAWDSLGESFQKLTAPGRASAFQIFNDGLKTMGSLLPTVAGIANKSMAAFASALQMPLKMLASPEFKGILTSLGDTFSKAIGPGVKAASLVFLAFSRIAQAAGPYVVQLAQGLERLAQGFANATANPTKLNATIGMLVSNTKSWLSLFGAVGRLALDFFKQGVTSGQGMVTSLTQVVNKWDAWVRSAAGAQGVSNFFRESAQFTREFFTALGPVVQAFTVMTVGPLPVYVSLMSKLKNIMGPLTYGFVAYKIALVAATAATKAAEALGSSKRVFGGLGAAASAAPVAASAATPAAVGGSVLGSLRSGLSATLTRGAEGLIIGTVGTVVAQAVGSSIHGAVGSAVKSIGSDAAIGAGFGSFFGPAGIAGGAVIGGLVGTFKHFILDDAEHQGKEWADKFLAPLPADIQKKFAKPLADAAKGASNAQPVSAPNFSHTGTLPINPAQFNAYFNALYKQGQVAGQAFVAAFSSVKIKTIPAFLSDATTQLDKLKGTARMEAASTMVSYAQSLEQSGKLPKGATDSIIAALENKYQNLGAFLDSQGKRNSATIRSTMKWDAAVSNLTGTETKIRGMFGLWATDPNINGKNVVRTFSSELGQLKGIAATTTGAAHKAALIEMQALKDQSHKVLGGMVKDFQTQAGAMSDTIAKGPHNKKWADAVQQALKNFSGFVTGVGSLMGGGAASTDQGANAIYKAVVAMMKSFGGKPPSAPQLSAAGVEAQVVAASAKAVGGVKNIFGAAGGLLQFGRAGDKGRDTIPVNFGGTRVMVGSGEVGAVFNHTQQKVANSLLRPVGGLPGLFANNTRPHYMAQGGLVGNVGAMIAEANRVDSKHFPYVWGGGHSGFTGGPFDCSGAVSDILHAGGVLNAPRVSGDFMNYGLPGPGAVTLYANPTHVYMSIDGRFFGTSGSNPGGGAGWFPGAPRPGFAVRHVGGGGGSVKAPGVKGTGTIASIVRRALGKITGAGNAYISRGMASAFSGNFGGGQGSAPAGANQALGHQMMLAAGWGEDQWPFLQALWTQESGWNANARNSSSGAAGIPQDITGNMHGGARGQIAWGLTYIRGRYGSPSGAEAHEKAFNWYAKGGMVPFVGSFAKGGIVPQTGLAHVHAGELIYPLDAQIAALTGQQTKLQSAPNATSKKIVDSLASIDKKLTNLNQLKAFKDAITAAQTQVKDLASQAAQLWKTEKTNHINAEHDARIKNATGGLSSQLATMQAQDKQAQDASTLAGLQQTLTDAQTLAAHSAGQTHVDALAQVKQAQDAITAFNRQQDEQRLQDEIDTATKSADAWQTTALAGLDQQTTDYQNALGAQLGALTDNLNARKLTYAQWASDVNAILAQYGLSVSTDASTEATVVAGPGPLANKPPTKPPVGHHHKKHRAMGGPVEPGYVYRVGENGPEDVVFGQRGTVLTASQTRRNSGGGNMHIEKAYFTGTRAAKATVDRLAFRAAVGTA